MILSMYGFGKYCIKDPQNRPIYVFCSVFIFTLFSAIRYYVGVDYPTYFLMFNTSDILDGNIWNDVNFDRIEWGFSAICSVFGKLNFAIPFYFGIFALLQIACLYHSLKKEIFVYPYLMLFLFVTSNNYFLWMNAIRQIIAFGLFLLALRQADTKHLLNFIILIIVASLFHKSAIILIGTYPLITLFRKKILSIKFQIIIFALCYILSNLHIWNYFTPIISYVINFMGSYKERFGSDLFYEANKDLAFGLRAFVTLLINLITIIYSTKMITYFKNSFLIILYNFFFIGIAGRELFADNSNLTRFFLYFSAISPIIYAFLYTYFYKSKTKYSNLMRFSMILLTITYLTALLIADPIDDGFAHYKFYKL